MLIVCPGPLLVPSAGKGQGSTRAFEAVRAYNTYNAYTQLYNFKLYNECTCSLCLCLGLRLFGSEQHGTGSDKGVAAGHRCRAGWFVRPERSLVLPESLRPFGPSFYTGRTLQFLEISFHLAIRLVNSILHFGHAAAQIVKVQQGQTTPPLHLDSAWKVLDHEKQACHSSQANGRNARARHAMCCNQELWDLPCWKRAPPLKESSELVRSWQSTKGKSFLLRRRKTSNALHCSVFEAICRESLLHD